MTHYENYCKHLPTLSGQHRIVATDNPINGQNSVYVVTETNSLRWCVNNALYFLRKSVIMNQERKESK